MRSCHLAFFLVSALVVASCAVLPPAPSPSATSALQTASPAAAATLEVARFPECPEASAAGPLGTVEHPLVLLADYAGAFYPDIMAQWRASAQMLAEASGLQTRVQVGPATQVERLAMLARGEVHLAAGDPLIQVIGVEQCWLSIAAWSAALGRRVMFVSRKDSGLVPGDESQVLPQLEGKRPCYPDTSRLAFPPLEGYFVPAGLLHLAGVVPGPPVYLEGLEENSFNPSLETGVYAGACDFAAVPADVDPVQWVTNSLPGEAERMGATFESWARRMQVLFTTDPIIPPYGGVVISNSVPAEIRDRLVEAMLRVGGPYGEALSPPDLTLAARFARIVEASGVDPQPFLERPWWTPGPELAAVQWSPAPEDVLVIDTYLSGGPPFVPNPALSSVSDRLILTGAYSGLVQLGPTGEFLPILAGAVPTLRDGSVRFRGEGADQQLEVEFRLRPNLRWQDGEALTAADLVFSWEYSMDPGFPSSHEGMIRRAPEVYVDSVEALGSDRVVFRFMSDRQARRAAQTGGRLGDPSFYDDLTSQIGPVVPLDYLDVGRNVFPAHLLEGIAPGNLAESEFASRPVFAGPYRIVEAQGLDKPVVLEANPYFVLGPPAIDRIVFGPSYYSEGAVNYWQSPDALAEAFAVGAIHVQVGLRGVNTRLGEDLAGYEALTEEGTAVVAWIPAQSWETFDFNLDSPHLADLRVRQAIAHAIDRQRIIDEVLAGHGSLMSSYLPAWHPLAADRAALPDYDFDPEEARALLTATGYDLSRWPATHPDRGPLRLRLASMDVNVYPRPPIAEIIRENLGAIGVEVDVTFYTWPEFEGQDCSAIRNGRRFDLGLAGWGGAPDLFPVDWVQQVTLSTSIPTEENGCPYEKSNWSGWRNPEADALLPVLQDGRLALENPELYRQAWAEHQVLWANELPSLPLFNPYRPVAYSQRLTGVQPSPFGTWGGGVEDTWNIYEWRLTPP